MKINQEKTYPLILVDDEDGFRMAVARRLSKRGFDPAEASSGQACLELLEQQPVSVVVLDVKMSGMDGIDTLKIIKQRYSKTQVILLTGNAAVSDGIEGIKSGAFDYLTKPVDLDHLTSKIGQALDLIRLAEEREAESVYRKKLEKKMVDTERLISLGTMSTGIAHEINNPLAIINESAGFMKLLLTSAELKNIPKRDALLTGITKIEKSVVRARKITHQLLGHVKKQGSVCLNIDIVQLVTDTLGLMKKEITDKKIDVTWETGGTSCMIWNDPYKIRQVLINLLDNAVHAVKKKGRIKLSIEEVANEIVLAIEDNGIGIPEENLGKIFDPFFTSKAFDEGTGLGLFVVHKILSSINGGIDVKSIVGKGSRFEIRLPVAGCLSGKNSFPDTGE